MDAEGRDGRVRGRTGRSGCTGHLGIKNHPPGRNREGGFIVRLFFFRPLFDLGAILLHECGGDAGLDCPQPVLGRVRVILRHEIPAFAVNVQLSGFAVCIELIDAVLIKAVRDGLRSRGIERNLVAVTAQPAAVPADVRFRQSCAS